MLKISGDDFCPFVGWKPNHRNIMQNAPVRLRQELPHRGRSCLSAQAYFISAVISMAVLVRPLSARVST